jgi:hypothetical protein
MELSYLNAGTALNAANIDLEVKKFRLRSFLGYSEMVDIELIVPNEIPDVRSTWGVHFRRPIPTIRRCWRCSGGSWRQSRAWRRPGRRKAFRQTCLHSTG